MTTHRLKKVLIAVLVSTATLAGTVAAVQASTLDSVLEVGKSKNNAARKSQVKIDRLADETRDLLSDYKTVVKQVDGLKVYNARLQKQIDNQVLRLTEIDESIDQSTIISRQMTPLVIRMIDGLQKFFREGRIGSWRDLFTEEQSKGFDARITKRLDGTGLDETCGRSPRLVRKDSSAARVLKNHE